MSEIADLILEGWPYDETGELIDCDVPVEPRNKTLGLNTPKITKQERLTATRYIQNKLKPLHKAKDKPPPIQRVLCPRCKHLRKSLLVCGYCKPCQNKDAKELERPEGRRRRNIQRRGNTPMMRES